MSTYRVIRFLFAAALASGTAVGQTIEFDAESPMLRFAIPMLQEAASELLAQGVSISVISGEGFTAETYGGCREIGPEGFCIYVDNDHPPHHIYVGASEEIGAMYGVLDVAEQVRMGVSPQSIDGRTVDPELPFRAIKFNLPWSPYREGEAMQIHTEVSRDLDFWRGFLDMMAMNRFNVLSLWNRHPFPYMIRATNFPEASPFSDEEMDEWRSFWKSLFRMAKNRGIETYIVNWNIVVSESFASAYGAREDNDTSDLVRRYTRESITQVINEYEDLTGVGVTLADWMVGMTPAEREEWTEDTFIDGMKAADRPVKFIHRSVLSGSAEDMRTLLDRANLPFPTHVEVKFNWSHGLSSPKLALTHASTTGEINTRFWDPKPLNYNIEWMIRNEDAFILRWGEPDFVREHIGTNMADFVDGYFIGSENYIPAVDYSHRPGEHREWEYAFEKQWLYYMVWGRLLFDRETPDDVFVSEFNRRHGSSLGADLLNAFRLASRMPLRLASFHAGTWDYTLYSEGFLSPFTSMGLSDSLSSFISIDEFINHKPLDPDLISIPEFVRSKSSVDSRLITPLQLADASEKDSREALAIVDSVRRRAATVSGALDCELADIEAWGHLGLYLADKLRAGVALETYRETGAESEKRAAVSALTIGVDHWDNLVRVTDAHYQETPYMLFSPYNENTNRPRYKSDAITFSWKKFAPQVSLDIEIAEEARPNVDDGRQ